MTAVRCVDLCRTYRQGDQDIKALDHVSIDIESGDFVCLSAPSGGGKTTLLNAIGGLDRPDSGEIYIADERIDSLIDLVLMCSEPLRGRGRYDYGESDLPARARKLALGLAFAPGRLQPPPPQALFIHRKLGGTYLVCSRLSARIDTRSLYLDHVAGRG